MEDTNTICDIRELTLLQLKELSDKYEWFGCAKRVIAKRERGDIKSSYLLCNIFEKYNSTALKELNPDDFIETIAENDRIDKHELVEELSGNSITSQTIESEGATIESDVVGEVALESDADNLYEQSDASHLSSLDVSQTDSIIDSFINSGVDYKIAANNDTPDLEINDFTDNQTIDDTMVSEELAEIYCNQKLYSQAIEIYRKLILLNPKKSVYFAKIISEIEKNINN